jgi:hypothetical protein
MGAAVIASLAARAERQLAERLRDAGAVSRGRAVPLISDTRIARRQLERLVHAGAVHEGADGYWLDEPAYAAHRQRRRRAAGVLLLTALAVAAAAAGVMGRR